MSNGTTLMSLAMLKVNQDVHKQDYLDYNLRPLVIEVLKEHCPAPTSISDRIVAEHLKNDYGLIIPDTVIHHILRRLAKKKVISKANQMYTVDGTLPVTDFQTRKAQAKRTTNQIIQGFVRYADEQLKQKFSEEQAFGAITSFLHKFAIDCLRTFVFNTALPKVTKKKSQRDQYCVSQYINTIYETDEKAFENFMVLVEGHMLANALLCPDLDSLTKSFRGLTIYLDTPLIIRLLKLDGNASFLAASELLTQLKLLGAKVAVFSHTREEVYGVLEGSERGLQNPKSSGRIIDQCRADGKSSTDIELERNRLDESFKHFGISTEDKPKYIKEDFEYEISESDLEIYIREKIKYREENLAALRHDIDSIRSIYALRKGRASSRLEDTCAVFLTTNSGLSRAAYSFGYDYDKAEKVSTVSTVITDYSLTNIAWLKAPVGAPDLPMREVLAYCYAGLAPTKEHWEKYLVQLEKLEEDGRITELDLQMLRFSPQVRRELMGFTCGEEQALQESTPLQIMEAMKAELTKEGDEEIERLRREIEKALREREELRAQESDKQRHVFWLASRISRVVSILSFVLLAMGVLAASFIPKEWFLSKAGEKYWIFLPFLPLILLGFIVLALNPIFGVSVKSIHSYIENILNKKIHRGLKWISGIKDEQSD